MALLDHHDRGDQYAGDLSPCRVGRSEVASKFEGVELSVSDLVPDLAAERRLGRGEPEFHQRAGLPDRGKMETV